jgi:hypothetical protein
MRPLRGSGIAGGCGAGSGCRGSRSPGCGSGGAAGSTTRARRRRRGSSGGEDSGGCCCSTRRRCSRPSSSPATAAASYRLRYVTLSYSCHALTCSPWHRAHDLDRFQTVGCRTANSCLQLSDDRDCTVARERVVLAASDSFVLFILGALPL